MKLYIIAGEASGDLHGSNLIKEIRKLKPDAQIRGWGGDFMQKAGAEIVKHYRDLAFMGFAEVLANLGTILGNLKSCKKDIQLFSPDAIILIDYPGFNLRIAKFAKSIDIKVFYYISPQLWAWNESRVGIIKKYVDNMFVILPFEKEFYAKHNYPVDFAGHPLLDATEQRKNAISPASFRKINQLSEKKIIALLPGSRIQEINNMLPTMLRAANHFPEYELVVAGAPSVNEQVYAAWMKDYKNVKIVSGQTYDLLENAHAALVTSGTATLETALFDVPEVVCYKGNRLSYQIAKQLVKVKFISLVNLIMDEKIVTELIQSDFNEQKLISELKNILKDSVRGKIKTDYAILKNKLGGSGASTRTAELMMHYLS